MQTDEKSSGRSGSRNRLEPSLESVFQRIPALQFAFDSGAAEIPEVLRPLIGGNAGAGGATGSGERLWRRQQLACRSTAGRHDVSTLATDGRLLRCSGVPAVRRGRLLRRRRAFFLYFLDPILITSLFRPHRCSKPQP